MPRYTISPATMAEYAEAEGAKNYESDTDETERTPNGSLSYYEPSQAVFDFETLKGIARQVYDVLRDAGVHTVVIRYDGGYDEGFAHFETARSDEKEFSPGEIVNQVQDRLLGEPTENSFVVRPSGAQISRHQWASDAVWEFAEELASHLLGRSYGTGEYSLYGHFRANLLTGEIVDNPTKVEDLPAQADEELE